MVNRQSSSAALPIPRRLRQIQRAEGFDTASEFCIRLGVSTNRYGNVAAGKPLGLDLAKIIRTKVPGMTLDWLYFGDERGLSVDLQRRLTEAGENI